MDNKVKTTLFLHSSNSTSVLSQLFLVLYKDLKTKLSILNFTETQVTRLDIVTTISSDSDHKHVTSTSPVTSALSTFTGVIFCCIKWVSAANFLVLLSRFKCFCYLFYAVYCGNIFLIIV